MKHDGCLIGIWKSSESDLRNAVTDTFAAMLDDLFATQE
jgi:hypothetical protein